MKTLEIRKITLWSLAPLVIPLFGDIFVTGWNWSWNDFLFAWIFFVILGLTFKFVTGKIANRGARIATSFVIVAIFAGIWVMLATG